MRASRMMSLLLHLKARGHVGGPELARLFEVSERTVQRDVEPLGLVLAAGEWYLVALPGGERRTYRVSRMTSVELLDQPATRPAGFDLAQAWAQSRSALESEQTAVEVTIRVQPAALSRLREAVPVHGQAHVPVTATTELELTVPFESEYWAIMALLGLGAAVEVLHPTYMRRRMTNEIRRTAARYAT